MLNKRILSLALALLCMAGAAFPVAAAEVDCDGTYCFGAGDFSQEEAPLQGICVTGLPDCNAGTVLLGSRVLRSGDILSVSQVEQLTFHPLRTQEDVQAVVSYLPIYENRVAPEATMTISIRGKEDKAPLAQDLDVQTYKNLPREGKLKVSDPEGSSLVFTVTRQPKRGEVVVYGDGTFLYTPNKNKVGTDSFVFTATDNAGNVSREATVTIHLMKPQASQYTDTLGQPCRFEAEWLKNTGLFTGETVNGTSCFQPEKAVSRGEFLAMVVKLLQLPMEENASLEAVSQAPQWLRPYVAAALRSGLLEGVNLTDSADFAAPITGSEAAVMLQNILDLEPSAGNTLDEEGMALAADQLALTCLAESGVELPAGQSLTRAQMAVAMYRLQELAQDAPGMRIIRKQK